MPARHILVTGFLPFAGDTANPSQELAKAMDGRVVADHAVRSLVLPVEHEAAGEIMRASLDTAGLTAIIHLGLAAGRARLSLERIAVNVMDYRTRMRGARCGGTSRAWLTVRPRMPAHCRCGRSWTS